MPATKLGSGRPRGRGPKRSGKLGKKAPRTSSARHAKYYAAIQADDNFRAALRRQFGPGNEGKARYYPNSRYSKATMAALAKKLRADAALLAKPAAKPAGGTKKRKPTPKRKGLRSVRGTTARRR